MLAMVGAVDHDGPGDRADQALGPPAGMNAIGFTGWTFLLGGLTLLPFTLIFEGLPRRADRPQHRRPGLPRADQRHRRVRAVVLGAATADAPAR